MTELHARHKHVHMVLRHIPLPSGLTMRAWTEADFAAIQYLSRSEGWSTSTLRPDAAFAAWQQAWPALVVTTPAEVIGFVRALTDGHVTLYIAELLVQHAWRGQGIGTALVEACQHLYPATRIDLLSTEGADAFYEAHGFRRYPGFRKSYQ
ncbi:MAG: GNAT family N-acetyltransferase [Chloroflexota bacterium]|nr:GNAT family N-acetyltransferase [Chloroflexota bacterium]